MNMLRRDFLCGLAGAAAFPAVANAQQKNALPVIGVLVPTQPDPGPLLRAITENLRRLGYQEGQNMSFAVRMTTSRPAHLAASVADLVHLKVDVIVAWFTPLVIAAKQATREIPIVMAGAANPVETGLVESLARPGGNVTGISGVGAELAAKCIELVRECLPEARRVGILANAADPFTNPMLTQIRAAARTTGLGLVTVMRRREDTFESAFAEMGAARADAVFVQPTLIDQTVIQLAAGHRLPSFSFVKLFATRGGLMSYNQEPTEQHRLVAEYIDKILKGGRPAEMPVAQPRKFELVINLETAKAIGVSVPPTLLARADQVLE
jgi:putative ABC transport system substrate-binding protein